MRCYLYVSASEDGENFSEPVKVENHQSFTGVSGRYVKISVDMSVSSDGRSPELYDITIVPPRTPWHNGKVERSHRNDQRYFYDWEHFKSLDEFNQKLAEHLVWSNNKTMRTLGRKSPVQLLREKLSSLAEN